MTEVVATEASQIARPRESPATDSTEGLVRAAQTGDHPALQALIELHRDAAFRVALRLSGGHADAEEVLQSAFERVVRHLPGCDATRPFRPWLMRIVVNQARTHWRLRRLKRLVFGVEPHESTHRAVEPDLDDEITRGELRRVIADAIERLPSEQREVFVLKHVEDYSYEEIASITGVAVGALRVRAHRARLAVLATCKAQGVTATSLSG